MQNHTPIRYHERPDATPEAERGALAAIYRLILDAAERSEAVEPRQADDLDDGTESKGDSADAPKYIRR